tara:strand:+ start:742 stop:867 length:126 start_codon:yes stop_codon:yes gene_type:complete
MKLSECCNAQLMKYDHKWNDGVCSKCNEHTIAKKELEDESA